MDHVEIVGHPPELAGLLCDALICEGYFYKGELIANANVVYLCFEDTWHKLVIDCGVIFWRQQVKLPKPWAVENEGFEYPHVDVGADAGVIGHRLESYEMATSTNGGHVTFLFDQGRIITIDNENDHSTFRIGSR